MSQILFFLLPSFFQNGHAIIIADPVSLLSHSSSRDPLSPPPPCKLFPSFMAQSRPCPLWNPLMKLGPQLILIPQSFPLTTPLYTILYFLMFVYIHFAFSTGKVGNVLNISSVIPHGARRRGGPKLLPLVFTIFHYVGLHWDNDLLPHGWWPGKIQHATSSQFFYQVVFWKYVYRQWPALGQREIVRFIRMLARGHTTRPLSTYQLCLRSWLMFFI